VATSAGVLVAILPAALGVSLVTWLLVFLLSQYVSLASILSAVALPLAAWALYPSIPFRGLAILIGGLVIVRHRANIQRLLAGTENRISFKRTAAAGKTP
jgi:glycerol-3-phosphate acyltransferase PlsY